MPAGVHAETSAASIPAEQKSEAQLRREAAKAQLEAEAEAESPQAEGAPSLSGTTAREDDVRESGETLRGHEEEVQT